MDKHNLLHPSLHFKNLKNQDEALFINGTKNGRFGAIFFDAHFRRLPKSMNVPVEDFHHFLDSIHCQNLKGVIFHQADYNNMCLIVNLEIRQMVYEEVRKRKWHFYLVHPIRLSIMSMLLSSRIDSKPGDVILNVLSMGPVVTVSELRRKQEGYSYFSGREINRFNRSSNDVTTECLGMCDPKYVMVCDPGDNDLLPSFKSRFIPSENVIKIANESSVEYTNKVLKTIYERGYNQLIPFPMDVLVVTNESNFIALEQAVIILDEYKDLPLEKVQIVRKSMKPFYVAYLDKSSGTYKLAAKAQISKEQEGHRIKLALVVDRNSLPFLYQEPYILPEIQALSDKLASQPDLNVPVIGFFDNSSVISVHDENGYKFLKEWNGLYGNDLYLNFEKEEPTIVTDLNKVKNKDPFVVYDLIKVLSMPADDFKANPKWGFKVINNDPEHPVLLQFETFLGTRKSSTSIFLMAFLLKHHIKAIKKETGKKPKELGFCLFNDFTNEEKKRIQNGLEEACKLLKIGFVNVVHV